MSEVQFASGISPLIEHGIVQYKREHERKPVALILHPVHTDEFTRGSESNPTLRYGVSVTVSPMQERSLGSLQTRLGN